MSCRFLLEWRFAMTGTFLSDKRSNLRGPDISLERRPGFTLIELLVVISIIALLIALLFGLMGCVPFPDPPEDDEGHPSFAREASVVLLGRRARGVDEAEALADISQLLGRDVAIEMLMKDEAFVDHWTAAIIDILEMQRDAQGGAAAQDSDCWGPPTRVDP